jgi:ABC-type multidrug transport system ATPase subunit
MSQTAALRRQPTGFQQIGRVEHNFFMAEHLGENDETDKTDLQRFVQSLKKIMGDTKFGLTFEFQNLRFHPKKAPRPILQDVSGCINAGSLWGVMGASGAGKCM